MAKKAQRDSADKVKQISSLLSGRKRMLIGMQDYPDPDAISSAAGLRALANAVAGVQCSLAHGGIIARAENRALADYLGLNLRPIEEVDAGRFDVIALVDTQPGAGNNSLPAGIVPDIVIDHHPIRRATRSSPFTDIRSRYGATSTIIYEYLAKAGVAVDVILATSLVYGIRSDTQDLGRETTQADINAFLALYPQANKRMLSRIEHARVPDTYFQALATALANADIHGGAVIAGIGNTDNPDMIAEIADLLLRREETDWVLCHGFHAGKALFSIRTTLLDVNAGHVARKIAGRSGAAGGHDVFAAGRIPLKEGTRKERNHIAKMMNKRYLQALRISEAPTRKLVKNPG